MRRTNPLNVARGEEQLPIPLPEAANAAVVACAPSHAEIMHALDAAHDVATALGTRRSYEELALLVATPHEGSAGRMPLPAAPEVRLIWR